MSSLEDLERLDPVLQRLLKQYTELGVVDKQLADVEVRRWLCASPDSTEGSLELAKCDEMDEQDSQCLQRYYITKQGMTYEAAVNATQERIMKAKQLAQTYRDRILEDMKIYMEQLFKHRLEIEQQKLHEKTQKMLHAAKRDFRIWKRRQANHGGVLFDLEYFMSLREQLRKAIGFGTINGYFEEDFADAMQQTLDDRQIKMRIEPNGGEDYTCHFYWGPREVN